MGFRGNVFMSPERVVFGRGVVADLGAYVRQLGGRRPFVVTDAVVSQTPAFGEVTAALTREGLDYFLYTDSDVNPTDVQIDAGGRLYAREKCDVIVGVGGGSSLDTAKSIGIIATNPGSIRDNFVPNYVTAPYDTPNTRPIPPTILIPTTAGTGSEVGGWTVVTNTAENVKGLCGGWLCLPKIALLDPDLTVSMPPGLTASTGFDALIHSIEAYYHRYKMPQTDMYALAGIRRIFRFLGRAVANGRDMEAREQMLLGAMEAGFAQSIGCGLIHSSGLQLTSTFHLPHGDTLSIMAGPVMRFNTMACVERMIEVAEAMGEHVAGLGRLDAAHQAADVVERFARSLGLPTRLSAARHDAGQIPDMAKYTMANDNTHGNPRFPTLEQVEALYHEAYGDA